MTFYSREFDRYIYINRKNKIRRLSLKVCRVTGKISINASLYLPNLDIINFFNKNRSWISKQLSKCVVPKIVDKGLMLPVEGNCYQIVSNNNVSTIRFLESNKICLPKNIINVGHAVQKFLIEYCRSIMTPFIIKKSNLFKKKIRKISFKDTKSRWGSCSSKGSIMLNWRLIMAPPSVYKYVIIHELSHLVHMNHGYLFWKLVGELHPSYMNDREWLKKNGHEIRKYIF